MKSSAGVSLLDIRPGHARVRGERSRVRRSPGKNVNVLLPKCIWFVSFACEMSDRCCGFAGHRTLIVRSDVPFIGWPGDR